MFVRGNLKINSQVFMGIRIKNNIENVVDSTPWAGLSSYEDPEKAKREGRKPKFFCGRDDESHQVAQLVSGNIFVTLYGKSGTGKTSLLNAGVFPRLRQRRYLPVSIRLSMDARDITFQQCIMRQLAKAASDHQCRRQTASVVPTPAGEQQPDYLWSYFARTRFTDAEGRTLFPVIVLDQFEEIFRDRRMEAEVLLRQIAYLMDESHALTPRTVDGQSYIYDFNFRFVASIREDDLYRLEDSIDNCYLPELKRCRYRLHSLSEQGARDAILNPGEGLFRAEEQDDIVNAIVNKSRNDDGSISTNIVSLLCSRIFSDYQRSGSDHITLSLVDSFIKGNPFERFYNEATRGFSNHEKSYIEEHLVDSIGRRNSIPESDFLLHVPKGKQLLEGENRILQRTSTSSDGGNYRVELIHDSFCEPLAGLKEKRERQKRLKWLAGISGIALISIGIVAFVIHQMIQVKEANWKMQENQSRYVAEKAFTLIDNGELLLARKLALDVLPKQVDNPNRPYVPEAEAVLRKINKRFIFSLEGHTGYILAISFSPDSRIIASGSVDKTVKIWSIINGSLLKTLTGHSGSILSLCFSPNGKTLITAGNDSTIRIWDTDTWRCIDTLTEHQGKIQSVCYNEKGKTFASSSDSTIIIWDSETYKPVKIIKAPCSIQQIGFSPKGKYFGTLSNYGDFVLRDAYSFDFISDIKNNRLSYYSLDDCFRFSNQDSFVVVTRGRKYRVYDIQEIPKVRKEIGCESGLTGIIFDGTDRIISSRYNGYIDFWPVPNVFGNTRFYSEFAEEKLKGHNDNIYCLTMSQNSKFIATGGTGCAVNIWNLAAVDYVDYGKIKLEEPHTTGIGRQYAASFMDDGKKIVIAQQYHDFKGDVLIQVIDVETRINRYSVVNTELYGIHNISIHGNYVFLRYFDRIVRIDINNNDQFCKECPILAYCPNGERVIEVVGQKGVIINYKNSTPTPLTLDSLIDNRCEALAAYSNDFIAHVNNDSTLSIWDASCGRLIAKFKDVPDTRKLVLSSKGKYVLLQCDKGISLYDIKMRKKVFSCTYYFDNYVFSDDERLLIGYEGHQIAIIDASTGVLLEEYKHPSGMGRILAIRSDIRDSAFWTISDNGALIKWIFKPVQQVIDDSRKGLNGQKLTQTERKKYYLED